MKDNLIYITMIKIGKVINSCKNKEQLVITSEWIESFIDKNFWAVHFRSEIKYLMAIKRAELLKEVQ